MEAELVGRIIFALFLVSLNLSMTIYISSFGTSFLYDLRSMELWIFCDRVEKADFVHL